MPINGFTLIEFQTLIDFIIQLVFVCWSILFIPDNLNGRSTEEIKLNCLCKSVEGMQFPTVASEKFVIDGEVCYRLSICNVLQANQYHELVEG